MDKFYINVEKSKSRKVEKSGSAMNFVFLPGKDKKKVGYEMVSGAENNFVFDQNTC